MKVAGDSSLKRELGTFGATFMGLGAMLGTGVFVSIGIAAGAGGPTVLLAIFVAAGVAFCNALSSAQLAANHPVSGGTYEYGYRYLSPQAGFAAGWMFLCAKSASAATAALGFSGYLLHAVAPAGELDPRWIAGPLVILVTFLVLGGMRRSSLANVVIVTVTLAALFVFVFHAFPVALGPGGDNLRPIFPMGNAATAGFLEACALMFVAYTGYGRIATMGEEVRDARRVIPRAILAATAVSALLYAAVGFSAIGAIGAPKLAAASGTEAAPLETVMRMLDQPLAARLVALGAITAMLGVLLNLILGISRVALAMGRRRDLPRQLALIDTQGKTPRVAVIATGLLVLMLTLIGDIRLTWSFSAFTVLLYYAITNWATLRLPMAERLYPRVFAWGGLAACLFLAVWVDARAWMAGLILLAIGLACHLLRRKLANAQ